MLSIHRSAPESIGLFDYHVDNLLWLPKRKGVAARRGLKAARSQGATRWTRTGYEARAPDEQATDCEVHIHQGRKA